MYTVEQFIILTDRVVVTSFIYNPTRISRSCHWLKLVMWGAVSILSTCVAFSFHVHSANQCVGIQTRHQEGDVWLDTRFSQLVDNTLFLGGS